MNYSDLSKRGRRYRDAYQLQALPAGQKLIHDHSGYETPMRMWVVQRGLRDGRKYAYRPLHDGKFYIWLKVGEGQVVPVTTEIEGGAK